MNDYTNNMLSLNDTMIHEHLIKLDIQLFHSYEYILHRRDSNSSSDKTLSCALSKGPVLCVVGSKAQPQYH